MFDEKEVKLVVPKNMIAVLCFIAGGLLLNGLHFLVPGRSMHNRIQQASPNVIRMVAVTTIWSKIEEATLLLWPFRY